MKQLLNIDTWARKDHFHFFRQFEEPFFGVCIEIDCTGAYERAKAQDVSFFLYYLHASLVAANSIPAFRYRINEGQVWLYDEVHASPTINRPDGTFGFAYMNYHAHLPTFVEHSSKEIEQVQQSTGLVPATSGENVIHYSAMPWLNFTSVSHARCFSFPDSCPKIAFGKMSQKDGRRVMPVSIHVHHALVDGYQVGQFADAFQELMK
ncbi:chloramphenicol acetyltransferase [Chitinophaga vietnamensis]|uniref:chloramphenicol acetyltransferase n=1 Tax=Chitinophaga vietnamensis TaxID=2593957 RepID=UPI0011784410|nr:chloramphenicol acetyltransferase [Chitinophaga vietnamensis]